MQKYYRELEVIVQECILAAIRESIPTEEIIRAYMDESVEQDEEVIIENIPVEDITKNDEGNKDEKVDSGENNVNSEESIPSVVPSIQNKDTDDVVTRLTFDSVLGSGSEEIIKKDELPKSLDRLEELSTSKVIQRKLEEEEDYDDRIKISGDSIDLSGFDVLDEEEPKKSIDNMDILLDDIEEL